MADATTIEPFLVPPIGVAEEVRAITEPVIVDEGCQLVFFQVVRGPRRTKVRYFIDTAGSTGKKDEPHIGIGDLERINRRLSDLLDVEDNHRGLFKGAWDLEVSSPGVDRPLAKRSHFAPATGQKVRVKLKRVQAGRRTHVGRLLSTDDDGIVVTLDSGDEAVAFDNIESAHVVFEFEPPGQKKTASERRAKKGTAKQKEKSPSKARAH